MKFKTAKGLVKLYMQTFGFRGLATPFTVDPTDESGPFLPFSELTEADIIAWIQTVVVDGYEEHVNGKIAEQIEQKITPVVEAKLLG
jgi:hypothetical protein